VAQAERDAGCRSDGLTSGELEELRRLRRENKTLPEEREILNKGLPQNLWVRTMHYGESRVPARASCQ